MRVCDFCRKEPAAEAVITVGRKIDNDGKRPSTHVSIRIVREACELCTDRLGIAVGNLVTGLLDGSEKLPEATDAGTVDLTRAEAREAAQEQDDPAPPDDPEPAATGRRRKYA